MEIRPFFKPDPGWIPEFILPAASVVEVMGISSPGGLGGGADQFQRPHVVHRRRGSYLSLIDPLAAIRISCFIAHQTRSAGVIMDVHEQLK